MSGCWCYWLPLLLLVVVVVPVLCLVWGCVWLLVLFSLFYNSCVGCFSLRIVFACGCRCSFWLFLWVVGVDCAGLCVVAGVLWVVVGVVFFIISLFCLLF